jgi:hypothetical protein
MLKLNIQCTRFESNCSSCEKYMYQQCRRSGKRKHRMKLSLPPKLVEKLVWVPVIPSVKFSFPVMRLMPYYAETGSSRPPNRQTLGITPFSA